MKKQARLKCTAPATEPFQELMQSEAHGVKVRRRGSDLRSPEYLVCKKLVQQGCPVNTAGQPSGLGMREGVAPSVVGVCMHGSSRVRAR